MQADWDAIERQNIADMLRHAKEAEAQGRSISAFYNRRKQRAFIAKHEGK